MKQKVSKKRKTSASPTQSTLDSFKTPVTPKQGAEASTRVLPESEDMTIDSEHKPTVNVSTILGSFRCHSMVEKIIVNNFKESRPSMLPDHFFDNAWNRLEILVDNILRNDTNHLNFQNGYQLCEDICCFGKSEELFNKLESTLLSHVHGIATHLDSLVSSNEYHLQDLNTIWHKLSCQLITLRNVFMELDRRYIMRITSYSSLVQFGKALFRNNVMTLDSIRNKTISALLKHIRQERDGSTVNRAEMSSTVRMLVELLLYATDFEPSLLEQTADYYQREADKLISERSIIEYLIHARVRCNEEEDRSVAYMDSSTKPKLIGVLTERLVYDKISIILNQGFDDMMKAKQYEALKILYQMLLQSNLIIRLRTSFSDYIKGHGESIMAKSNKDLQFVETILQFKSELDHVIEVSFNNDFRFISALKESFEVFINKRQNKSAESVAKFIDIQLRTVTRKAASEEDVWQLIDRVLTIFRYIQGKDAFEAYYKRFLAKRLLLGRNISSDLEKNVISKLKKECGPEFTRNLDSMIKDIEVSADLNNKFKVTKEFKKPGDMSFYVNVLAQGVWPTYSTTDVILSREILECQQAFERFYTSEFRGRVLSWRNSLGTCALRANFPKGSKELTVSFSQASILLLFNDSAKSSFSYNDLLTMSNIDPKELSLVLKSLSCGQHKIISKQPPGSTVNDTDTFMYNNEFTATPYRIRINTIQQEQSPEEKKETETKVMVNRQHQLEAAIVRIMKARKKLTHSDLVQELFMELKFPVDASDIKKRIESLIDRDYLARDENDNATYLYQS